MRDVELLARREVFRHGHDRSFTPANQIGLMVCDAAAAVRDRAPNPTRPTWINYTGGDTLHSVVVTGAAVYVQGHPRWLNNPYGLETPGPGAVERKGIAAINPSTGLASSWNPGKTRGIGGMDLYATPQGLWVPSDTEQIGGENPQADRVLPPLSIPRRGRQGLARRAAPENHAGRW